MSQIKKISGFGKSLSEYSRETVQQFFNDAKSCNLKFNTLKKMMKDEKLNKILKHILNLNKELNSKYVFDKKKI